MAGGASSSLTRQDMTDYIKLIENIYINTSDKREQYDNIETILRLLWTTAYNKGCRRATDPY